ncbi:MAG: hypothetical protein HY446_00210, partial [Candidatus Niyogibacteria bacterium]|nr:hypothetical protein [Candidatus Niyogibacteria bacterium]
DRLFPETKESLKFFIDVNDYEKQKIEEIKDMAKLSAQRVRFRPGFFQTDDLHDAGFNFLDLFAFSRGGRFVLDNDEYFCYSA